MRCLSLAILGTALVAGCGSPTDRANDAVAGEFAAGLHHAIAKSVELAEPHRCARLLPESALEMETDLSPLAARPLTVVGQSLNFGPRKRDHEVVLGVIADMREQTPAAAQRLAQVIKAFELAKVELVFVLGGIATDTTELETVVAAVTKNSNWVTIVLPGDRERVDAVRATVAKFTSAAAVLDGTKVRFIDIDGAMVATFPGVPFAGQLVSGADGCRFTLEDAQATAGKLAAFKGPRVWVGYTPPRQTRPDASDLSHAGVHVGDLAVAAALAEHPVDLVIHGSTAGSSAPLSGVATMGVKRVDLGAGSLDPLAEPDTPMGLIIRVGGKVIRWSRPRASAHD